MLWKGELFLILAIKTINVLLGDNHVVKGKNYEKYSSLVILGKISQSEQLDHGDQPYVEQNAHVMIVFTGAAEPF